MKKAHVWMFILALIVLTAPFSVFASEVKQIDSSATQSNVDSIGFIQPLGNGISGYPNYFEFYANHVGSSALGFVVLECTNNLYSSCANVSTLYYLDKFPVNGANNTKVLQVWNIATTSYSFDPTKFYIIALSSGGSFSVYGSNASTTANFTLPNNAGFGKCGSSNPTGNTGSCMGNQPVKQAYFRFQTTASSGLSTVTNLSPATASTTAATTVNFSFNYSADSADSITNYRICVRDVQAASPILCSFILTGSASTGTGSVSRTAILTSGHLYDWYAQICSASGVCSPQYYQQQRFSVVTPFYLNGSGNAGLAPTTTSGILGQGVSTTSLSAVTELSCGVGDIFSNGGIGQCIASVFAYLFIPSNFVLGQFSSLGDNLLSRQPFIYVKQIEDVFNNETVASSTANFPLISIPLSTVASSTITGVIPDIGISTSTISTYLNDSTRNALRTLIIAGLWFSGLFYLFYRVFPLFRT